MLGVRMLMSASAREAYKDVVLADNPTAYWPLQETSGTIAADATGNGWNGNFNNVTLGASGLVNEPDQVSADFSGSNSYVSVPSFTRPNATRISLEVWGILDVSGINQTAIGVDSPISGNLAAVYFKLNDPANMFAFTLRDTGGSSNHIGTGGSTTGTIYHLVSTYDGTTMRLYKNGVEIASTVATFTISGFTGALTIGCGWYANSRIDFVNGRLAHAAVYDYALSPSQVDAHYKTGT